MGKLDEEMAASDRDLEDAKQRAKQSAVKLRKYLKSETITIRIGARDRYELDLAARSQGRTITAVILRALQDSYEADPNMPNIDELWSPHEADRLVLLAYFAPNLMTDEQKTIWKDIIDGLYDGLPPDKHTEIDIQHLRDNWDSIVAGILKGVIENKTWSST